MLKNNNLFGQSLRTNSELFASLSHNLAVTKNQTEARTKVYAFSLISVKPLTHYHIQICLQN